MTPRAAFLFCLLMAVAHVAPALALESPPQTYVADRAGVIESAAKTQLIGLLQELEQKTNARVIVLTVNSTNGQNIHQYAFERADKWKFGANQKSASVLIVVAVRDRKYWTEVGYNHEHILPDSLVGTLGRQYLVPHFKAGRYNRGILEYTAAIASTIAQANGKTLTGMPKLQPLAQPPGILRVILGFLPILFLFIMAGASRGRGRNMLFWGLLAGSMMGGRGGGRSGGFGGGGFGGFGGGGGGGFGGGGAGGSW